jgi:hypothetical protein
MPLAFLRSAGIWRMTYLELLLGYWGVRNHPQPGGAHMSGLFWLKGRVASGNLTVLSLVMPFSGLPSIACSMGMRVPPGPRVIPYHSHQAHAQQRTLGRGALRWCWALWSNEGWPSLSPSLCTESRELADSSTASTVPPFPAWVQWQTPVRGRERPDPRSHGGPAAASESGDMYRVSRLPEIMGRAGASGAAHRSQDPGWRACGWVHGQGDQGEGLEWTQEDGGGGQGFERACLGELDRGGRAIDQRAAKGGLPHQPGSSQERRGYHYGHPQNPRKPRNHPFCGLCGRIWRGNSEN